MYLQQYLRQLPSLLLLLLLLAAISPTSSFRRSPVATSKDCGSEKFWNEGSETCEECRHICEGSRPRSAECIDKCPRYPVSTSRPSPGPGTVESADVASASDADMKLMLILTALFSVVVAVALVLVLVCLALRYRFRHRQLLDKKAEQSRMEQSGIPLTTPVTVAGETEPSLLVPSTQTTRPTHRPESS